MTVFFVIMPYFVKIILVELSNETCEITMLEVLGEDGLGETFVLRRMSDISSNSRQVCRSHLQHYEASAIIPPSNNLRI